MPTCSQVLLAVHPVHAGHVRVHSGPAAAAQPRRAAGHADAQAACGHVVCTYAACACVTCVGCAIQLCLLQVLMADIRPHISTLPYLHPNECMGTCTHTCMHANKEAIVPIIAQIAETALPVLQGSTEGLLGRCGKWELLSGEGLLPGDLISIGRPVGGACVRAC
eukprot:scaffold44226_cov28-Tisochrysis_lutea.AAC.1